jgi:D-arabinose 1-dehydrogenase-like Zn-dependent alcohol dehydrogenase
MIEKVPLEKAGVAFEGMMNGKARFRVVLAIGS